MLEVKARVAKSRRHVDDGLADLVDLFLGRHLCVLLAVVEFDSPWFLP